MVEDEKKLHDPHNKNEGNNLNSVYYKVDMTQMMKLWVENTEMPETKLVVPRTILCLLGRSCIEISHKIIRNNYNKK